MDSTKKTERFEEQEPLVVRKFPLPPPYHVPKADTGEDRFCVVVENAFSKQWCDRFIKETEDRGYEAALLNVGEGQQVLATDVRNSSRCVVDDFARAAEIWERIKPAIPERFQSMNATRVNERLRCLRYDPGEYFKPHYDGSYLTPDKTEVSRITILIYLNEGYKGGHTNFLSPTHPKKKEPYYPTTGSVLAFEHRLLHEGAELLRGRKYIVRTEVMYSM